MTETKKFVVVDGPINHDHELYQNGDSIELPVKSAARLLREKKVAPAKPEKPKANPGAGENSAGNLEGAKDSMGTGQDGKKNEDPKDKPKGSTKGGKK
jgi:hypothetical protein